MLKKKLILVAAPPASGKTYVSELIAKELRHTVYLDKDDLADLVRAAFSIGSEELDMDGDFYINNVRPHEYSTILNVAFSALRFEDTVILNAPFGKEVRDGEYMHSLKCKANRLGAELILIWVSAPTEVCRARMAQRGSDRDKLKLEDWESYVKKINYTAPSELADSASVDKMLIFDTASDITTKRSLEKALELLKS
jgi:predicted kinase